MTADRRAGQVLAERLESRRDEIEQTLLTRVYAVSDPAEVGDPEYVAGLTGAVHAALSYCLSSLSEAGSRIGPAPTGLLAQARQAARNGISIDTVLRRYVAGFTLLGDFVIQEAGATNSLSVQSLQHVLRGLGVLFDRLVTVIANEYNSEITHRLDSHQRRRTDCVERLLAGELTDTAQLAYEVDAWHIGAIAEGPGAEGAIRSLARALDCCVLLLYRHSGTMWVWIGGQHRLGSEEVERVGASIWPEQASISVGEPARGLAGWRLTHRQACAAWPIALRRPQALTRYAEVGLLASILRDDVLSRSLHELYLVPLSEERDGGAMSRKTLRAYFAAERNISSTAAALKLNRGTIASRLRAIEDRLDCSLNEKAAEIDVALRLGELGYPNLPEAVAAAYR